MNVAFGDFLEWKRAVHSIYRLGNYHISYFRRYSDCRYNNKIYPIIYHFIVRVTELQLATGQIVESSSHKYVALEDGVLRVCLGHKDLKPATEKFRRLARMASKTGFDQLFASAVDRIDMGTGMLARAGWIEEAERELERSRRYGSSFCMGVMGFAPKLTAAGDLHGEETLEKNMAYISGFVKGRVRKTDVIGRCSDLSLALLFPEIRPRGGRRALEKLASFLQGDEYIKNNFPCQISAAIKPVKAPIEDELDTLLRKIGIERPIKE
jgi:GGDEF domain-containing protein